jgi:hypothetical protein
VVAGVRYIAIPLSQEPCFLIAGNPNSRGGVLAVCQEPPFYAIDRRLEWFRVTLKFRIGIEPMTFRS